MQYRTIMPDYFRSIGISLKAGRTLNESDTATAEKAVVVNEAFVKDYLADVANPLGQRVYIGKVFGFEQPWRIVGVVSDARQFNLRSAPPASVFVSALQLANAEGKFQSGQRALKFVIRTTGDPLQLGAAVRQAMLEIEPNLPLTRLRSMEQIVARSVAQERFNMSTKRLDTGRWRRANPVSCATGGIDMNEFLVYEQDGPIVVLTMNQPERRNPLTGNSAVADFLAAIDRIHDDRRVRCVILTGAGPSFSAGGDIREMKRLASPAVSEMDIRQEYRRGIQRLTLALFNLEVPVIAAVNGHAIGAGLDLACMCDIRIASEKAKFAESFVRLGIIPGDGGAWLLPRIVGMSRAAELAFTGDTIDAQQALAWNLVSRVVPHDELMAAARELAGRIAQHASHGLRLTKRLMREAIHARLDTVLEISATFQAICHKTPDHSEAVDAFLEKRAPRFD